MTKYDTLCFFKWLLNSPISHTRHFSFRVNREGVQQFCFHNIPSLQNLRRPAFLNPARYIFMAMYLDGAKAK